MEPESRQDEVLEDQGEEVLKEKELKGPERRGCWRSRQEEVQEN